MRDFSATAIELHGKASSTEAQQALGARQRPQAGRRRGRATTAIYAEVRALAGAYVMPD